MFLSIHLDVIIHFIFEVLSSILQIGQYRRFYRCWQLIDISRWGRQGPPTLLLVTHRRVLRFFFKIYLLPLLILLVPELFIVSPFVCLVIGITFILACNLALTDVKLLFLSVQNTCSLILNLKEAIRIIWNNRKFMKNLFSQVRRKKLLISFDFASRSLFTHGKLS